MDRTAARCSRSSMAAAEASVGAMGNATRTTSWSKCRSCSYPASRNTRSMALLFASVSATNRVMPREGDFCRVVSREPVEARHGHQLVVDQRD